MGTLFSTLGRFILCPIFLAVNLYPPECLPPPVENAPTAAPTLAPTTMDSCLSGRRSGIFAATGSWKDVESTSNTPSLELFCAEASTFDTVVNGNGPLASELSTPITLLNDSTGSCTYGRIGVLKGGYSCTPIVGSDGTMAIEACCEFRGATMVFRYVMETEDASDRITFSLSDDTTMFYTNVPDQCTDSTLTETTCGPSMLPSGLVGSGRVLVKF